MFFFLQFYDMNRFLFLKLWQQKILLYESHKKVVSFYNNTNKVKNTAV